MSLQEDVAENLRVAMAKKRISATDVFEKTGVARSTLSALTSGASKGARYETLEKICDYLEIPVSELFIQETKKSS